MTRTVEEKNEARRVRQRRNYQKNGDSTRKRSREYGRNHRDSKRESNREYLKTHREERSEYLKKYRQEKRAWLTDYKATLSCTRCPESDPVCLDFHHLDENNKIDSIATMVNRQVKKELILAEIEKCIVLCNNCHHAEHASRQVLKKHQKLSKKRQAIREWYDDYKTTLKCNRCPESKSTSLAFHHLDTEDKTERVSVMVSTGANSKEVILAEINKCEVLCGNCHRKEHRELP